MGRTRLKVLVGCEYSQVVTNAFRDEGHEAYSCDILPTEGNPDWHIQDDVLNHLDDGFDLGIFHPSCQYLTVSANKWTKESLDTNHERQYARDDAIQFFMKLMKCNIPKVAVENPIGIMSSVYRKPDQVLQPWQYGHGETKATCLWLKGLPKLEPTDIVKGREQRIHLLPKTDDRWKIRSKTFEGIAKAMAQQWIKPKQLSLVP